MSAWEDSKTYISEAPPDGRHMLAVLSWYVFVTILIRGPELSEDLRELDPARRKIKTAMEFMKHMGYPISRTQLNLTRELVLSHYTQGVREWGSFVHHFDDLDSQFLQDHANSPSEGAEEDDLAEWLEKSASAPIAVSIPTIAPAATPATLPTTVPVRPSPPSTNQDAHPLRHAVLTIMPRGRRLVLHHEEGVKTWAMRLSKANTSFVLSNITFLSHGETKKRAAGMRSKH
ncbi:hypothetical protein NUW54_g13535 [Trametes sanguinea]|uniref:Uncharacterized protein n=1 Tax=Trametes sanguinea TaxID=158606 RepID=A0ACC1MJY5_9APHY|nr:hypothetical protein NUW54_g13535 [Trametes sanguinea]